ncbi:MAG: pyridoxal phosphate-dependent decarboxylase family protein [Thermoleophilaceae bacterium]
MPDPGLHRDEVEAALELASSEVRRYLDGLDEAHVQPTGSIARLAGLYPPFPEKGDGALAALTELADIAHENATRSSGPRFFHFVIGGTTPAALGADWLASAVDQNAGPWAASPLGAQLEVVACDWLRQLFRLPDGFRGVLVTGATMANFTGLAAARSWWGQQSGVPVDQDGMAGAPPVPVFTSGIVHASAVKSIGMLGIGRSSVRKLAVDGTGRLDVTALERELAALEGAPAIVIANAGDANSGAFDPIDHMADLAERYNAWLHVDGAFGIFARVSPELDGIARGMERAMSVGGDGHKWLNVPYDCGFVFVRDWQALQRTFGERADYLPPLDDPNPSYAYLAPESSRRARAFAVWATLRAYGADGYRAMVERHVGLARHLARLVDDQPELERLAEVTLNIVCFRVRPDGVPVERLDELNRRVGEELLADGRVFAGTTIYDGKVCFRPAIVNWRTRESDVELLVDVVLELSERLRAAAV